MGNGFRYFDRLWPAYPLISIVALLFVGPAKMANGESRIVEFPVTNFMGETITLTGKLTRPKGEGPFPAVVFLHGCEGVNFDDDAYNSTASLFIDRGYVVLQVDSFGPRGANGVDGVCDGTNWSETNPSVRARDAHAGKDYLANLSYVGADRIAVMGWSHGANSVLYAVSNSAIHEPIRPRPFRAAIAFYPRCDLTLPRLNAPLLVLIGDADDWSHAAYCKSMELQGDTTHEYQLIVYPGATHAFDSPGEPWEYLGHKGWYDPEATTDAYKRAGNFLERYMQ